LSTIKFDFFTKVDVGVVIDFLDFRHALHIELACKTKLANGS
jgi:hypothetical protein